MKERIERNQRAREQIDNIISPNNIPEEENIFLTIGAGTNHHQLWPHLYHEAIQNGESAVNIIFDGDRNLPKPQLQGNGQSRTAVAGGFFTTEHATNIYKDLPHYGDHFVEFKNRWRNYLENCLRAGKKVFLGYHIDGLPREHFLETYNELKEKYPNQLYLMLGHYNYAAVALGPVTEEELDAAHRTSLPQSEATAKDALKHQFAFFSTPSGQGDYGFSNPAINITNLQRWTREAENYKTFHFLKDQFATAREKQDNIPESLAIYTKDRNTAELTRALEAHLAGILDEHGINTKAKLAEFLASHNHPLKENLKEFIDDYRLMVAEQLKEINNETGGLTKVTPISDQGMEALLIEAMNNWDPEGNNCDPEGKEEADYNNNGPRVGG